MREVEENYSCVVLMGSLGALATVRNLVEHNMNVTGVSKRNYLLKTKMNNSILIKNNNEITKILKEISERNHSKIIVFTDSDEYVEYLLNNKKTLSEYCLIPYSSDASITESLMNKSLLYKVANELSIDIPKTYSISDINELTRVVEKLAFPVLVKPSKQVSEINEKVILCDTFQELEDAFLKYNKYVETLVIQEYIKGTIENQYCVTTFTDKNMNVHIANIVRKKRQYPSLFGMGSCHIICYNKDILDIAYKILKNSKYEGISMMEFKYSSLENKYYLIEINCRLPIEMQLNNVVNKEFLYNVYKYYTTNENISFLNEEQVENEMKHEIAWVNASYDIRACRQEKVNFLKEYYFYSKNKQLCWSILSRRDKKFFIYYICYLSKKIFKKVFRKLKYTNILI
ncbi:ATP-binding protein [Peptostreptococcus faecalis]|uniref:ATP-binding protein n=1 Tax=Peptostreptococcus faecalis TaxID=2045015 RepID=UPI000C7BAA69|nr:hypothetical protein [Peptostreptococcus faecalis]